jgi:hypothetical protein
MNAFGKSKALRFDTQKENLFKELTVILHSSGYTVRREKLKSGHGWRVLSGSCRSQASKLIFVDKRMSQDDQIEFLVARLSDLKLSIPDDKRNLVSPEIIQRLG